MFFNIPLHKCLRASILSMPYIEAQSQKDNCFWNNESVYTLYSLAVSSYCLLEQSSDICMAADL